MRSNSSSKNSNMSAVCSMPITKLEINGQTYTLPTNEEARGGKRVITENKSKVPGVISAGGLEVASDRKENLTIYLPSLGAKTDVTIKITFEPREGSKPNLSYIESDPEKINGYLYTPYTLKQDSYQFVTRKGAGTDETFSFAFKTNEDVVNVYEINDQYEIQSQLEPQEDGQYGISFQFDPAALMNNGVNILTKQILLEGADERLFCFSVTANLRSPINDFAGRTPDAIVDYICPGSQYSAGGNRLTGLYGLEPEKSLIGIGYWWSPISLGNFGGYITYYYEDPIVDDPGNQYGIDFIVYGNSNGSSVFSEPGNVLVSEDGTTWYTLAGSDHFEDTTIWNYEVTYTRENEKDAFPSSDFYPLHDFTGVEDSIAFYGTWLPPKSASDAAFPAWGYADTKVNSYTHWGTGSFGELSGKARNPYWPQPEYKNGSTKPDNTEEDEVYEFAGDAFDLAWAVDEEGNPVDVSDKAFHFVKIQTASNMMSGGFGEKSAEVNCVVTALPMENVVGKTAAPEITIGGKNVSLSEKKNQYVVVLDDSQFTVDVVAAEGSNIYINNARGNSRSFDAIPEHGIVRVIVQDGDKEPFICYLSVAIKSAESISDLIEDLPAAEDLTLDDKEAVEEAKAAYDALSEEEKEKVDSALVNDLKLAVATIEKLEAEKEVEEKQNTIDQLQEQLAEVSAQLEAMKEQLAKTPGWHQNEDGSWYFCDNKGETVKGWVSDGGKWYFMNKETGIMQTGWVKDGSTWYYMSGSGAMVTGWQQVGGKWYFFKSSGAMAASEWCEGYWLNADGSWTYQPKGSWKKNNQGWWFGDTSGWYAKNTTQKIDGTNYKFNAAGYWVQ